MGALKDNYLKKQIYLQLILKFGQGKSHRYLLQQGRKGIKYSQKQTQVSDFKKKSVLAFYIKSKANE